VNNVTLEVRGRQTALTRVGRRAPNAFERGVEIGNLLGVLLLAHGGPGSVDDIPAFLEQVRGGRPSSKQLVDEVRERYRLIGGASPLPGVTKTTAEKLERACGLPVYVGMAHWHPFLEDTVQQMVRDGVSRALVICVVPHYSALSIGRYRERMASAANEVGMSFDFVESWHTSQPYVEGLAASIVASGEELGCGPGIACPVIFSAHSLPKAALPPGDPYQDQLRETAERVAEILGLSEEEWNVAYQSASVPGETWLGPSVDETIRLLADRGESRVVLCPCGFVAEQVEILYDLDIVSRQKAASLGVQMARTQLLGDGPAVVDTMTRLVERWQA